MSAIAALMALIAAYLIGSVPTAYVIVKAIKGIDIRTVGSGNVGATNAGRVLGFRYFVLIFLIDLAKGFVPTWLFPQLAERLTGPPHPALAVGVALAAILGHNFPIYLKFRGGKGVATSLGAVTALDPISAAAAAIGFGIFLTLTKYVSMASLLGGGVFALTYFARTEEPFTAATWPLSTAVLALLVLLIVRHRKNLLRIAVGTEPKVLFRRKRETPESRSGRIRPGLVVVLVGLSVLGVWAARTLSAPAPVLAVGGLRLGVTAWVKTGYQRAERVAFLDSGKFVAVTCPRYSRALLYATDDPTNLRLVSDIALEGRPLALGEAGSRWWILQNPPGDERHVRPAWIEAFDHEGRSASGRIELGQYADDMAIDAERHLAYVLVSERAEGDSHRPLPALMIVDLCEDARILSREEFRTEGDDPARLVLLDGGRTLAVALHGSNRLVRFDVTDPAQPFAVRSEDVGKPIETLAAGPEGRVFASTLDGTALTWEGPDRARLDLKELSGPVSGAVWSEAARGWLVSRPLRSCLEAIAPTDGSELGEVRLRGTAGLAMVKPLGLALDAEHGRVAVANAAGGSLFLLAAPMAKKAAE